jgi:hypothetical protein
MWVAARTNLTAASPYPVATAPHARAHVTVPSAPGVRPAYASIPALAIGAAGVVVRATRPRGVKARHAALRSSRATRPARSAYLPPPTAPANSHGEQALPRRVDSLYAWVHASGRRQRRGLCQFVPKRRASVAETAETARRSSVAPLLLWCLPSAGPKQRRRRGTGKWSAGGANPFGAPARRIGTATAVRLAGALATVRRCCAGSVGCTGTHRAHGGRLGMRTLPASSTGGDEALDCARTPRLDFTERR